MTETLARNTIADTGLTGLEQIEMGAARIRVDDKKTNPDLFQNNDDDVNDLSAEDYIKALQQLPASFRAVYNMNVIEEYPFDRISVLLEVSEASAQNTLERAKNQLAKNLLHQMQGYA